MKNPQPPGRDESMSSLFWKFSPWSPLQTRSSEGEPETHEKPITKTEKTIMQTSSDTRPHQKKKRIL
jgi:hypothetical protein